VKSFYRAQKITPLSAKLNPGELYLIIRSGIRAYQHYPERDPDFSLGRFIRIPAYSPADNVQKHVETVITKKAETIKEEHALQSTSAVRNFHQRKHQMPW
jgi:hypothetical protein